MNRRLFLFSLPMLLSGCQSAIKNVAGLAQTEFTFSQYTEIRTLIRARFAESNPILASQLDAAFEVFDTIDREVDTITLKELPVTLLLAKRRHMQAGAAYEVIKAFVTARWSQFTPYEQVVLLDYQTQAEGAYDFLGEQIALLDARNAVSVDVAQYRQIVSIGRWGVRALSRVL